MRKLSVWLLALSLGVTATAQQKVADPKVFWKEDFKKGVLPEGWKNVDVKKKECAWVITNQPYPGSFEYQQQAPPIASKSRGYHLQYQAGYFVDEDQPGWEKKGNYPDAWMQTTAIHCGEKNSVLLRFQQTFRYNGHHPEEGAGLYVGISTDSINWHDMDVRHGVAPATDMFNPMQEELNISQWAAHQSNVYIRFYWKGFYSWYWMIDDIELAEAYTTDVSIVRLTSHNEESNVFKKDDVVALKIRNSGTNAVGEDFTIDCNIDNKQTLKVTVPAGAQPFAPGEEREVVFPAIDLTTTPTHTLQFGLNLEGDERKENNRLRVKINAQATPIGKVTGYNFSGNTATISSGISKVKVIFYSDDIFRIWLAPDGQFTDPAGSDIVNRLPVMKPTVQSIDGGNYYKLQGKFYTLRIYKAPLTFALYDKSNTKVIWKENRPMLFGAQTVQFLQRQPEEYLYGCGMQNGYFSHRDREVLIEKGGGWDDGGRSNPVPFYMSTAGYGVLRNTFDAGKYSFKETMALSHNENRFDAFYFYGPSLKEILNQYTTITGRPFLMPRWALSMGDANCYNKPGRDKKPQSTPDVVWKVADEYIKHDMPRGWILPNDGYGCGYAKLDSVVKELKQRGFYTGLWTENGIQKIATEVGQYGTRLCKLDVAWVGPGYKFALDACKSAYEGIENNSDGRGFIWSVMGWAGTHRYSTVWSGDQSGNWEYIRFHIPTFVGSGLTAQNAASSDIDGIFRGSDSTYTRDLEWKCFIPVLMTMSGWAPKDKQPWIHGEPFTSINRKYLQLKMRFTPYMYTLCAEAYATGVPATRGMVLEFPKDSVTWGKQTQYQFMNGPSLLVAPVYKSEGQRDSIYLPKGDWYDYWNGMKIAGGKWLRHYEAPLEKLPLFVKAGAILPMYPSMNYDGEKRADTLTLILYPSGYSSFILYEDDGLTREHRKGAFAKTQIELKAGKDIALAIHAAKGTYKGSYAHRVYLAELHMTKIPRKVLLNGKALKGFDTKEALMKEGTGYYFDENEQQGVLHIRTSRLSTSQQQQVLIRL